MTLAKALRLSRLIAGIHRLIALRLGDGDLILTIQPAAQIDQLATIGTEWKVGWLMLIR